MLKRQQILLTDWLSEFIKFISERYDISFSEVVRAAICIVFSHMTSVMYPGYKLVFTEKDIARVVKKINRSKNKEEEELHKLISRIYFEGRKATEFVLTQVRKSKK